MESRDLKANASSTTKTTDTGRQAGKHCRQKNGSNLILRLREATNKTQFFMASKDIYLTDTRRCTKFNKMRDMAAAIGFM